MLLSINPKKIIILLISIMFWSQAFGNAIDLKELNDQLIDRFKVEDSLAAEDRLILLNSDVFIPTFVHSECRAQASNELGKEESIGINILDAVFSNHASDDTLLEEKVRILASYIKIAPKLTLKRCFFNRPIFQVAEYLPVQFQQIVKDNLLSYEVVHDFYELYYRYPRSDISQNAKGAMRVLEDAGYDVSKYRQATLREYWKKTGGMTTCQYSIRVEHDDTYYSLRHLLYQAPDLNSCKKLTLDAIYKLETEGEKVNRQKSYFTYKDETQSIGK